MRALRMALVSCVFLAAAVAEHVAAVEPLRAEEIFDLILASRARYQTFSATVEQRTLHRLGSGEWETESTVVFAWRQRTHEQAFFLQIGEGEGETADTRIYVYRGSTSLLFSDRQGHMSGKIRSGGRPDQECGMLTPEKVLWDPLCYTWDVYVQGARELVRKGDLLCVTSEILDGRVAVTITVDPKLGYLPVRYEAVDTKAGRVFRRYSCHDFRKAGDLWVPFRYESHSPSSDGVKEDRIVCDVKEVAVNKDLPDEQFDFQFPPGTRVYDETKQLEYEVAPMPTHLDGGSPPATPGVLAERGGAKIVASLATEDELERTHAQAVAMVGGAGRLPAPSGDGHARRWLWGILAGSVLTAVGISAVLRRAKSGRRGGVVQ